MSPSSIINPRKRTNGMLVAWLILAVSITVTIFIWDLTKKDVMQGAGERFNFHVSEAESAVRQRMLAYEHLLRGGAGLMNSSQKLTRGEWRTYVASLNIEESYPGIQGIGFSKHVLPSDMAAHIRQIRSEGFPNYRIWPDGPRTEYTSIIYLEPFNWRNQRAFGYDMFTEPVRREAMEQARDTGKTAISGKVRLVQETEKDIQNGFLMYLPVYRKDAEIDTVEKRRSALVGYVYSPFRMNDLMHGILGREKPDIDIEIFDGAAVSESSMMYDEDKSGEGVGKSSRSPLFTRQKTVDINGRDWTLFFCSTPAFEAAIDKDKPVIVLTNGIIISLLFFAVAASLASTRERAVALANEMTQALRDSEEERLALQAQMLNAQKLESLGVLAGGIAHDFNNILMSIMGNTEMALINLQKHSAARKSMEKVRESVQRAAELTKQMLAYSGKGKFVVENIDLSELVKDTMELLNVSIGKNVEVKYNLALNLPQVEGDATQMRQILMNLVINASDAIGDREGTVSLTTGSLDCDREYLNDSELGKDLPEGTYVYMEISDTGSGMDDETKARIFDPFFTTKFTGRGLGLAAVLGIVRGHKGALKIESRVGAGTTFRVLLPKSDKYVELRPVAEKEDNRWKGSGTALVIDDEDTVVFVTQAMLEEIGFSVLTATDGPKGIELYRDHADEISVVLLDLTMPRMNGEEVFRELKKIRDDVRVILNSGYNVEEISVKFRDEGFAGFLHKPYTMPRLTEKLREVLGGLKD